jgi:hypothetical protein
MNIERVDPAHVHHVWPVIEGFIASALDHSKGDYTLDQVKTLVAIGNWTLLVAVDDNGVQGAATVDFFNRPNDRVAFITSIGGRLVSSPDSVEQLKNLLGSLGATCIEGAARESIARLWSRYGFEEKYRIVGVRI